MPKRKRTSSARFVHEPLANPETKIRLLRFKDKRDNGQLRNMDCELSVWPVDKAPPYAAASYTWGSPEDTTWILLDGHRYEVRQNALQALAQIRQQAPHSYIWMDSICINQEDLDEKAFQVAMMGDIYERAELVYCCVGEHADGSEDVMDAMKEVVSAWSDDSLPGEPWERGWKTLCEIRPSGDEHMDDQYLRVDEEFRYEFRFFGDRPYWNRIWIVQEVRLARRCLVLCGDDCVSLDNDIGPYFESIMLAYARDGSERLPWYSCGMRTVIAHPGSLNIVMRRERVFVGTALARLREYKCSDVRDRLYGLSKIVDWPTSVNPPKPDYRISSFELAGQVLHSVRGLRSNFNNCAQLVERLLSGLQITVREQEVQQAIMQREAAWSLEQPMSRPFDLVALNPDHFPRPALPIIELEDGKLSLDVARYYRPSNASTGIESRSQYSRTGLELWADEDIVGYVCPHTLPGDILVEVSTEGRLNNWMILRHDASSALYDIIGQGFTVPLHSMIFRSYHTENEEQAFLYQRVPLFFDLWLEDEDFLLWSIYQQQLRSGALSEEEQAQFLEYRIKKSRLSSYGTLREKFTDISSEYFDNLLKRRPVQ